MMHMRGAPPQVRKDLDAFIEANIPPNTRISLPPSHHNIVDLRLYRVPSPRLGIDPDTLSQMAAFSNARTTRAVWLDADFRAERGSLVRIILWAPKQCMGG